MEIKNFMDIMNLTSRLKTTQDTAGHLKVKKKVLPNTLGD